MDPTALRRVEKRTVMSKVLTIVLVCCAACATLKTAKDGSVSVEYQGTASGAAEILAEQNRRLQTMQAGQVALNAIEKKMPTTFGQDAIRSDVQAGWQFGYGYGYGMYGLNGGNLTAGQIELLGQQPGYLPRLGEAPIYVQSGSPQVAKSAGGNIACPNERIAQTDQERIACNERDIEALAQRMVRQKKK